MIIEYIILTSTLIALMYYLGQMDLSYLEKSAAKYRKGQKIKKKGFIFAKFLKFNFRKQKDGGDVKNSEGAAGRNEDRTAAPVPT